jgi:hypothetical protein
MNNENEKVFQIGDVVVIKYHVLSVPTLYGIIIGIDPKITVRWKNGAIERYSQKTASIIIDIIDNKIR